MTEVRLVCVGDSFTEGMCDELRPDGHHRGWSDRVAEALAARATRQGESVPDEPPRARQAARPGRR